MPIRPVVVGLAAGAVLAAGGLSALDLVTTSADAQGGGPVSQAQFRQLEARVTGVGQNSSAAQRISKNLQNFLGKHVVPEGTLIGAKEPPGVILQDRGLGDGLPEAVLSAEVRAKLNADGPQGPAGSQGLKGDTGPQGPPGSADIQEVPAGPPVLFIGAGLLGVAQAGCPPGSTVVGGSLQQTDQDGDPIGLSTGEQIEISTSYRVTENLWRWVLVNDTGATRYYVRSAICAGSAL